LVATLHWLHTVMDTCHLDLCLENVMIENCEFLHNDDGSVRINGHSVSLKLVDFGCAECFKASQSKKTCFKSAAHGENELFACPQMYEGLRYDPKSADVWSLGMMMFEVLVGRPLYCARDMWAKPKMGYRAVLSGALGEYLHSAGLLGAFKVHSLDLVQSLLAVDEEKRFDVEQIAQHAWFGAYYKKYRAHLEAKYKKDRRRLQRMHKANALRGFPFYGN